MKRFEDQVAIVVGADRGIGLAIAKRFAMEGANVVLASNRAEVTDVAEELQHQVEAAGLAGKVIGRQMDVTDSAQVEACYASVVEQFSRLDISVQNAGIITIARLQELPEEDWDKVMDVNTKGVFLCCKAALKHMEKAGRGTLINMASGQARQGFIYTPHYAASKFGVLGITQSLAREFAPVGITINAICPGIIETEMWAYNDRVWGSLLGNYQLGELMKEWVQNIPMKRAAQPEEVAGTAAFLASEDARYITGQSINVDGGLIMS